jgi:hypothetical protein
MTIGPQLTSVVALAAVGWTMVAAGRRKRLLEPKRRSRRCPSCGHVIAGRTCDRH